ncbi:unnamed protein product, partial [Effrenium voratum]
PPLQQTVLRFRRNPSLKQARTGEVSHMGRGRLTFRRAQALLKSACPIRSRNRRNLQSCLQKRRSSSSLAWHRTSRPRR